MRRSRLLALLAALTLALLVAACDTDADPGADGDGEEAPAADTPAAAEAAPDGYAEAPMLAELVDAGELPPVDERLPDEPMVVTPHDRIGVYGGTWNAVMRGASDRGWIRRNAGYDHLMRWEDDLTEVSPNIAESVEVNDEATEFTFHLRAGMRWSDGEPFTAHDISFWFEDVASHPELDGSPPTWILAGGEPPTVEAVDDHTVTFTFPNPTGVFLHWLAAPQGLPVIAHPRHYLEQFHADYNPDIDDLVADSGQPDWAELFYEKSDGSDTNMTDPDLPTLRPWRMTNRLGDGPQVTFERNPYYWKVDPDGNQLPYLDRVVFDVVEDDEVILFKVLNGELSWHVHYAMEVANRPIVADHQDEGDYHFITEVPPFTLNTVMMLNLTHKDPALREIFQDKDFRIGISHAIDREEIIDVVFTGHGSPSQPAERPEDPDFYDEEMATQYTEHDLDLANEHLDRAGLDQRGGDGYRLRPDGERMFFQIDVPLRRLEYQFDVFELVARQLSEVGVHMEINAIDDSLYQVRVQDNDHDAGTHDGGGGMGMGYRLNPRAYFPFNIGGGGSAWATEWARWYQTGGEQGEEPPEAARRQMELYDQFLSTPDRDEQAELWWEILEISKEEFWVIGISRKEDSYGIVRNNFHNVPDSIVGGAMYQSPAGPSVPEQFFVDPQ